MLYKYALMHTWIDSAVKQKEDIKYIKQFSSCVIFVRGGK